MWLMTCSKYLASAQPVNEPYDMEPTASSDGEIGLETRENDEPENGMVRLMYYCTMFRSISFTLMAIRTSPPGYLTRASYA